MITKIIKGSGVSGAVRYCLGEGRGAGNDNVPEGEKSRVAWVGGQCQGFTFDSRHEVEVTRRMMERLAQTQSSTTKKCEQDCVHLVLSWREGETPNRWTMEEAAKGALKSLGMENAYAVWTAHRDTEAPHLHIVASKINPLTGKAFDLRRDHNRLSVWAETYEREHGGIVCTRRVENNALRDAAISAEPERILDALTRAKATFTAGELDRVLDKAGKLPDQRKEIAAKVLGHAEAVKLDKAEGKDARYTTKTVLAAETRVLTDASDLARAKTHALPDRVRWRAIEARPELSDEQRKAVAHASGKEGIALINGQAGTGKSLTVGAIREAHELTGYRVIGLAPTNAVAEDMRRDGFKKAGTAHSELFQLKNGRTSWDKQTLIVVDEAAMLSTELTAALTSHARAAGAKLVLVGDDRQLASIERGGMFRALADRHGAAALTEVRRQKDDNQRQASKLMAQGDFKGALAIYQKQGAIQWQDRERDAKLALVERWARDHEASPEKSRFVFAYTNADVAELNAAIRVIRQHRGELGRDVLLPGKDGLQPFAKQDRIQFTATDKRIGIHSGALGTVTHAHGFELTVQLDGAKGRTVRFDAREFNEFRHGYAGTIYKGQGRTLDQTYLYHSAHWRSATSYVALTRHREGTAIFVARETAHDLRALSRQMGRLEEKRAAVTYANDELVLAPSRPGPAPEPTPAKDRAPAAPKPQGQPFTASYKFGTVTGTMTASFGAAPTYGPKPTNAPAQDRTPAARTTTAQPTPSQARAPAAPTPAAPQPPRAIPDKDWLNPSRPELSPTDAMTRSAEQQMQSAAKKRSLGDIMAGLEKREDNAESLGRIMRQVEQGQIQVTEAERSHTRGGGRKRTR